VPGVISIGLIKQSRENILYILLPGDSPGHERCNLKMHGDLLRRLPVSATSWRVCAADAGMLNKF
jgi:hypothetical protein